VWLFGDGLVPIKSLELPAAANQGTASLIPGALA
jgi:hypothetical protein